MPNVSASRGNYRSNYIRPTGRNGRAGRAVVPAGRGPGGAGSYCSYPWTYRWSYRMLMLSQYYRCLGSIHHRYSLDCLYR